MQSTESTKASPWYAALIVALGVHVMAQLLVPMAERRFEAEVWVRRANDQDEAHEPYSWPELAARRAHEQGDVERRVAAPSRPASADEDRARKVIVIASDPATAEQQCREAAIEYASLCQRAWVTARLQERIAYDWKLEEARHYERKAWDALERFLIQQFSADTAVAAQASENGHDTFVSSADQEPPEIHARSVRREMLQQQLKSLQNQLVALRASKTDAHPQVQQLQQRLIEVEQSLSELSGQDVAASATPQSGVVASAPPVARTVSDMSAAVRCENLMDDFRAAVAEREKLERERIAIGQRPVETATCLVGAVHPAIPIPSSREIWRQIGIWAVTLATGVVIGGLMRSTQPLRFLHGEWDSRRALGIPVLGSLAGGGFTADRLEALARRRKRVEWMIRCAEYALFVVALACVWSLWSSSELRMQFRADPWWTVSTMVQNLW